jgi:hypothetical protein
MPNDAQRTIMGAVQVVSTKYFISFGGGLMQLGATDSTGGSSITDVMI